MAKANYVNKARKDYPEFSIKKGVSYWWWKKWKQPVQRALKRPTKSQLTNSPFLAGIYDIEDSMQNIKDTSEIDSIRDEIQEMLDEQEEALENMPEQLQTDSYPENRVEYLQQMIDSIESIDMEETEKTILEDFQNIYYEGD